MSVDKAIEALRDGRMILLYDADDREGETDLAIPSKDATPKDIARMRRDGGGLICVALHPRAADMLGLPFMSEILAAASNESCCQTMNNVVEKKGDIPYDASSSFSIWVNHRDTYTGITDNDRALTINRLGIVVDKALNGGSFDFSREFRSPGHVAILRAAEGLVHERKGQTELSVALAEMADITPAIVICEMLDAETGKALSKKDAMKYASEHGLVFLEGAEIISAYTEQ